MSQGHPQFDEVYTFIENLDRSSQDEGLTKKEIWRFNNKLCDNASEDRVIYCCDVNAWVVKFAFMVEGVAYLVVSKIVTAANISTNGEDKKTTVVKLKSVCKREEALALRELVTEFVYSDNSSGSHYNGSGNIDPNGYEENAVYYIDPFYDISVEDKLLISKGVEHYTQYGNDEYFTTMFPYIAVFNGGSLRCISSNNYPSDERCYFPWWSGVNVTKITKVNFKEPRVKNYIDTSFSYLEGAPIENKATKYILKKFKGATFDDGIIGGRFTALKLENKKIVEEKDLHLPLDIISQLKLGTEEALGDKILSYVAISELFFGKKNRYNYYTTGERIVASNDFKKTVENLNSTNNFMTNEASEKYVPLRVDYIELKVAKKEDVTKKGTKKDKGKNSNKEGQEDNTEDVELNPLDDVELETAKEKQRTVQEFDDAINKKSALLKIEIDVRRRNGKKRPSLNELKLIREINELYGDRTTFLFGSKPLVTRTKKAAVDPPSEENFPSLDKIRETMDVSKLSFQFRVNIYRKGKIHPTWNVRFRKYYPFESERGWMFVIGEPGNIEGTTKGSIPVESSKKVRVPMYGFIKIDIDDNHILFDYDIRGKKPNEIAISFIEGKLSIGITLKRFEGLNDGFFVSSVACALTRDGSSQLE